MDYQTIKKVHLPYWPEGLAPLREIRERALKELNLARRRSEMQQGKSLARRVVEMSKRKIKW